MKKSKRDLVSISLFTLVFLVCACKPTPTLQAQQPPAPAQEQPAVDSAPSGNFICGMVENRTDTGAFSPTMTVSGSGQEISLDALINDMLTNYSGQFPNTFVVYEPLIEQGEDLHGGTTFSLTGYSSYEMVAGCP